MTMTDSRFIRCEVRDDGVAMVVLDHPEKSVNTLSPALIDEFNGAVMPLLEDPRVLALVVSSAKKHTFIAGADLDVLENMDSAAAAAALSRDGNALLERVALSAKPVVAAVHGAAIGGGLEVALACHYILASDHEATLFALPEVMLGLLPGGGGTQRLLERVGLTQALGLLLTGKRLRARKAYRLGLVDAITTPGGIADTAASAALALATGALSRRRSGWSQRLTSRPPLRWLVLAGARRQAAGRTRGNYPAPPAILDCVKTGLSRGRAAGLERESENFGRLVMSPESRALTWLFKAMNRAKKEPDPGEGAPVQRLAVLGAGFMGSGIAAATMGLGPVVVRDLSEEVLAGCGKEIRSGLDRQVKSGSISRVTAHRRWSRLLLTTEVARIAAADLVVEAVFEDLELKRKVLAEVEELVRPEAVIASNTSALAITRVAAAAARRERVLGMHYFSPVHKMPLLEIVVTPETADWALARALGLGRGQGKTCIVVRDGPGFYTTRILAPYLNEAMVLLGEGARIEDVDRALLDFGYPVGPVALLDEVGIDVAAHVANDLGAAFGERGLGASDVLPKLAAAGFAGRKNRRGFYLYPDPARGKGRKRINPEVYGELGGGQHKTVPAAEIADRLSLLMVNEAVHCLQEGVVASPTDGDLGAVLGLGFPPFRGGPFHHVDAVGAAKIVRRLEELERLGPRFTPAAQLVDLARSNGRFYGAD